MYDALSGRSRVSFSNTENIKQQSYLNNQSEKKEYTSNEEVESVPSNNKAPIAVHEKLIETEEEIALGYQLIEEQERNRRLNKRIVFGFILLTLICILGGIWFFTRGPNDSRSAESAANTTDTTKDSFIHKNYSNNVNKKDIPINNNPSEDNEIKRNDRQIIGSYVIISQQAHFFNQPNFNAIRNGYLIKNNKIEIEKVDGEFGYGAFTDAAKVTRGWLLLKNLKKITNHNTINTLYDTVPMPEEVITKDNNSYSFYSEKPLSDLKNIFENYCSDDNYFEDDNSLSGYGKQEHCYFIILKSMGNKCKIDYSWECDRRDLK